MTLSCLLPSYRGARVCPHCLAACANCVLSDMADKIATVTMNVTGGGLTPGVPGRMADMQDGTFSEVRLNKALSDIAPAYKAVAAVTLPATATDVSTISGSATKAVYVTGVYITGTQTTLGEVEAFVIKRSAANTGGTATNPSAIAMDSSDPAATAVVAAYSVNPAGLGAVIGSVARRLVPLGVAAGSVPGTAISFGDKSKPVVLRGTSEFLALNLGGLTILGGALDIEW